MTINGVRRRHELNGVGILEKLPLFALHNFESSGHCEDVEVRAKVLSGKQAGHPTVKLSWGLFWKVFPSTVISRFDQ